MAAYYGDAGYQKVVSSILYQFAEKGLKASDTFYTEGNRLADNVFKKLQNNAKKFKVVRVIFSGSYGKKTDVIAPDLDLVVTVSNFMPPLTKLKYKEVLEEFEEILLLNESGLRIREGTIEQKTPYSVQFTFDNGIEVDLLPAADLKPAQVYKLIEENPKDYYSYSLCLAAKQVEFVKSHPSSFVHCLIRLIKYWYKSLVGIGKLSGGSYIMEVMGVAAATEEENKDIPDILRAFTRAIDWFCKLNTMKLTFRQISGQWVQVPSRELQNNMGNLIPTVVGTRDILQRRYYIIDPANPYNDLLGGQNESKIDKLMAFAKVTRKRLDNLMGGHNNYLKRNKVTGEFEVDILQLFLSQPQEGSPQFPLKIPKNFYIRYDYGYSSLCGDLKVRNERVYRDLGVRNCVEVLKWNLICGANSAIHGNPRKKETEQKKDIKETVRHVIKTSFKTDLGPTSVQEEQHEEMDVTLTVPYRINDVGYAVKCSLSWN